MTKETIRKCSHCGYNGHNSRTCKGCSSIKLFGVKINVSDESHYNHHYHDSIRKSKSLGSLQQALKCANNADHGSGVDAGYLSDDPIHLVRARKKGTSWTEDEHHSFLIGLEKLGKGDWRGISKNYVPSRTPTQVASHAQKYFIRMSSSDKKKRRTSVFDLALNEMNQQNAASQGIPSPSSDEAPLEIPKQAGVSPAAPLVNKDESKGKAIETAPGRLPISPASKAFPVLNSTHERPPISPVGTSFDVPNSTCERPPISPMPPFVFPSFNRIPYMNRPATRVMPTVSWAPVMNYHNQSYGYIGNFHGNYASCVQYMSPQPASLLPQQMPRIPPQAGLPAPATKNDSLDLSVGALRL